MVLSLLLENRKKNEVDEGRYSFASYFINICLLLKRTWLLLTNRFTQLLTYTQPDFIGSVCWIRRLVEYKIHCAQTKPYYAACLEGFFLILLLIYTETCLLKCKVIWWMCMCTKKIKDNLYFRKMNSRTDWSCEVKRWDRNCDSLKSSKY